MAREEADREDLLREAKALVERVEMLLARRPEPIVVGFRRDGSASFYFGADPVYQFNSGRQLRRAYREGCLFKADRGQLARLERRRTEYEVQLVRTDLAPAESRAILAEMTELLDDLRRAVGAGDFQISRQSPEHVDIVTRIRQWLEVPGQFAIASSPRVG